MRVAVYEEGCASRTRQYPLEPCQAVKRFANECQDPDGPCNVVATPMDDEAKALPGWKSDEEEPLYMLFRATPTVEWKVCQVDTFNPYQKATETDAGQVEPTNTEGGEPPPGWPKKEG